ncbi:MAG: SpoIIE family protein phosphatase [Clostridia bacterium]|nr:SpoIIE family protein phosphatase [Clostridia bacterium]
MNSYVKLGIAAFLPVILTAIAYILQKKTKFGKLSNMRQQILLGIAFGGLAVIGTEWGIPVNGAQVNCRDAAVLTAGLVFGGPAGIIAGFIGGIERWIAVEWGVGSFTRVACSVSTIIAGFYAAVIRKYLFENKKPGWLISLAVGVVMEVFHLTMVFITNMATPEKAMSVVAACSVPMITSNGLSVFFSTIASALLSGEGAKLFKGQRGLSRISQTIQRWLLLTVACAFLATSLFVFNLQNQLAMSQMDQLLSLAIDDVDGDILDVSNENLLNLARYAISEIDSKSLAELSKEYGIAEISIVNSKGLITDSTTKDFIGYDMNSGRQSREFMCLLGNVNEYVQDYGPISYDTSIYRKYAGIKYGDGFVQFGYDAEEFQKNVTMQVVDSTANRHVGQTGYILIVDADNAILSAPKSSKIKTLTVPLGSKQYPDEDTTYIAQFDGVDCYMRFRSAEGYRIVSVLPEKEAMQTRNIAMYVNVFMEILVFAVMFGLIYMLIRHFVVRKIEIINHSLSKITDGNLDEVVNVRSNSEFASLSDDINMTVDTLKRYISEAEARIDKELEFAKNIQASALPSVFPAFPKRRDFDIYASMDPAKEVGGDFYDFYMTGSDMLHFLIADVSGKGIPAAMFMMRAKTELKSLTETEMPIDAVFTNGNHALCEGNDAGMFVTAWQGDFDLKTGLIRYANAGHNPPLIRHANGQFEYLRSRVGFVLAGMDDVRYRMQELQLAPGDIIVLYTDGVTEATNANSELYGEERLLKCANTCAFTDMQSLCTAIKADADAFVGEAPQFDDMTLLAIRYYGPEA